MIRYRSANNKDIQALQVLHDVVFSDVLEYDADAKLNWMDDENNKKYYINLLSNPENLCIVAEDNDKLIAYITATPKSFEDRKSKYIEIQNLGVLNQYRKQGVGQQLVDQCLLWAKDKGYQKAYLRCYAKNTNALDFYVKNAFSPISISLEKNL